MESVQRKSSAFRLQCAAICSFASEIISGVIWLPSCVANPPHRLQLLLDRRRYPRAWGCDRDAETLRAQSGQSRVRCPRRCLIQTQRAAPRLYRFGRVWLIVSYVSHNTAWTSVIHATTTTSFFKITYTNKCFLKKVRWWVSLVSFFWGGGLLCVFVFLLQSF